MRSAPGDNAGPFLRCRAVSALFPLSRFRRWLLAGLVLLLTLSALAAAGYQLALRRLQSALLAALGPRAQVTAIEADWTGLTVRGLRLGAAPGWPADEEFSAERVVLQPDLRSLWSGPWRLHRIDVDRPRLSLLRGRDGRLQLLPGLLAAHAGSPTGPEAAASASPGPTGPQLILGEVRLREARIDFYDASFGPRLPRPHHLVLDPLDVRVGHVQLPGLDQPLQIALDGVLQGAAGSRRQDGRLHLTGELTPAHHDADLRATLQGVDLRVLQPYLLKVAESGVRRGTLDLDLKARLTRNQLQAPGRVTLTGLELGAGAGVWDQLGTGVRQAALGTLARDGRIEIDFTLAGRLDDPAFSLNESLAARFAAGLAEAVGVSVGGVVQGVGRMIQGLLGR